MERAVVHGRGRRARLLVLGFALAVPLAWLALERASAARAASPALAAPLDAYDPAVAEAVDAARAEVRAHAEDALAWGTLGMTCAGNALPHLALPGFRRAAELAPRDGRWPYFAALVLEQLGRPDEALRELRAAAALAEDAHVRRRLGFALLERGELEPAAAAFRAALEADDSDAGAWCGLGRVASQRDEPAEALRHLQRATALAPDDGYVVGLLGVAYRAAGRPLDAEPALRRGLGARPRWPDPWARLLIQQRVETDYVAQMRAASRLDAGAADEATALLDELLRERPESFTLLSAAGLARARAGRFAEARDAFARCLELQPDSRQAAVNLATALGNLGELRPALATVERALAAHPTCARAHEVHGALLVRAERMEAGAGAHEAPGAPLVRAERMEAAADAYARALELDARRPKVLLELGHLQLALARTDAAEATFARAVELEPDSPDALLGLSRARLVRGDVDGAGSVLSALGPRRPGEPAALVELRADLARARAAEARDAR